MPWFGEAALREALGEGYVHLPELGGRRRPVEGSPNGGWSKEQFRGYADHMRTKEFAAGLERLLSLPGPTAVMCAEALWWQCHRRMVADALLAGGTGVQHIAPDGRLYHHELTEFAVVEEGRVTYPPAQGELVR